MQQDNKQSQHRQIEVRVERDVLIAAAASAAMAREAGFSVTDCARIETAVSELARNQVVHASGGVLDLAIISNGRFLGLRVCAVDSGQGIQNVSAALQDGYTTRNTLGIGLGVAKRMMDDFSIRSHLGWGTRITAVKWKR
ncbi:MAG: ATP-binding protein [Anaerolineae bacterium]|nr:ATP-binding protein [Anaerolineae bacterium]